MMAISRTPEQMSPEYAATVIARLERDRADLLAALKTLLTFDAITEADDKGPRGEGWQSDALVSALSAAKAAIAKAEGR